MIITYFNVDQQLLKGLVSVTLCRLDIGDGIELDLKECPRSKLRQQCIKYLGPVCVASQLQFIYNFKHIHFIMTMLNLSS